VPEALLAYRQANGYRELPVDLSSTPSAITLPAGMQPTHQGLADGAHAYSVHGTTLGRIDPDGVVETLTIPTSRRLTFTDDYIWCASTDSSGQLVRVPKDTFDTYDTFAIVAGSGGSYSNIEDYIATDENGNIWIAARQSSPSRTRLAKFIPSSETWGSPYTLSQSLASTIGYQTLRVTGSTAFMAIGDSSNAQRVLKVDLTDGSTDANVSVSSSIGSSRDVLILGTNVYVLGRQTGVSELLKLAQSDLTLTTTLDVAADGSYVNLATDGDDSIYTVGGRVVGGDDARLISASNMTVDTTLFIGGALQARYCTYFEVTPAPSLSGWGVNVINW